MCRKTKCCGPSTWDWECCSLFLPLKFKKAQSVLERAGEKSHTIGRIVKGERKVTYSLPRSKREFSALLCQIANRAEHLLLHPQVSWFSENNLPNKM